MKNIYVYCFKNLVKFGGFILIDKIMQADLPAQHANQLKKKHKPNLPFQ